MEETNQERLNRIKAQHDRAKEALQFAHPHVAERIAFRLFETADIAWLLKQAELAQKYLAALKGIDLNIHDTKQVSEILDIALEEQQHGNY